MEEYGWISEDCKRKWKFLRDGYIRFMKRSRNDPYSAPPKNSKNKRHQLLSFLEKSGAVALADPEVQIEEIEEIDDTTQENYEEFYAEENKFTFVNTDIVKRECDEYTPQAAKRQKVCDRLDRDETIAREREDDIDLFCRHIAQVLRNMPPLFKAKAKKEISTVVSDYEIKAAQSFSLSSEVNQDD